MYFDSIESFTKMTSFFKKKAQKILAAADIRINGERPWDIVVHDERLYRRVMLHGSLGLGEAYMDGWWEAKRLDEFFTKVLQMQLDKQVSRTGKILQSVASILFNKQSLKRAFEVGERHYDIGNDLYAAILDKRLLARRSASRRTRRGART